MAKREPLLKEKLHDELLKDIITKDPGEELILTEAQVMENFEASKSTAREALLTLCCEGVLKSIPRFGYRVVRLSREDILKITDLRLLLELDGLKKGYDAIRGGKLRELRQYLADTRASGGSHDVWEDWDNNRGFHLLLNSCAGNPYYTQCLRQNMDVQRRAFAQLRWQRAHTFEMSSDFTAHERIVAALEGEDLEAAQAALKNDILRAI